MDGKNRYSEGCSDHTLWAVSSQASARRLSFNTVSANPRGNSTDRPGNQPKENFSVTSMIQSLMQGSIRVGPVYSTTDDPTPLQSQKSSSTDALSSETGWHKKVCWHRKCHPSVCVYSLPCGQERRLGREGGKGTKGGSVHTMTQVCARLISKLADSKIFLVFPGEGRTHL